MRKKFKLLGVMLATSLLFLSACNNGGTETNNGSKSKNKSEVNISVVLKTLSSPYWKYVEAGAKDAGKKLGVNVTVVGPPSESEVMQQVNMIEDQLSQAPDGIAVAPIQAATVISALSGKDLPMLTVDTDSDFEGKLTYIGSDNHSAGKTAAELLIKKLNKGDKVAMINGALGNPAMDERAKGAKETFKAAGIEVVAEQAADSDKAKAMSVMENILQTHSDIKAVYAGNDDMAIGALRAIKAAGLDIMVVGTDGTEEAVKSIIEGGLYGTIAQKPYDMGYLAVENLLKAINGEKIKPRIDSGLDIVTSENAEEFLEFLKSLEK
ncbi:sugar ABC transporter substrate-binding protein [Caldifermentibacillus hisashii]|uniref:sugar ABC transporter substrate-binding protein n=1 Tax=Caldifermentibacillus hisashii TaxID=996558 RepID=UPI003100F7A9